MEGEIWGSRAVGKMVDSGGKAAWMYVKSGGKMRLLGNGGERLEI